MPCVLPSDDAFLAVSDTPPYGTRFAYLPVRYMGVVFAVFFAFDPAIATRVGVDASELADAMATTCFEDADTDRSGSISFDEFAEW